MAGKARSVSVSLNPGGGKQNLESLQRIFKKVGGLAGCDNCGRIAFLKVDFLVDPPADLARDGVISLDHQ
jgi:hypothetical protein